MIVPNASRHTTATKTPPTRAAMIRIGSSNNYSRAEIHSSRPFRADLTCKRAGQHNAASYKGYWSKTRCRRTLAPGEEREEGGGKLSSKRYAHEVSPVPTRRCHRRHGRVGLRRQRQSDNDHSHSSVGPEHKRGARTLLVHPRA